MHYKQASTWIVHLFQSFSGELAGFPKASIQGDIHAHATSGMHIQMWKRFSQVLIRRKDVVHQVASKAFQDLVCLKLATRLVVYFGFCCVSTWHGPWSCAYFLLWRCCPEYSLASPCPQVHLCAALEIRSLDCRKGAR